MSDSLVTKHECVCGHGPLMHWRDDGITPTGRCDVPNCGCHKFRAPAADQASAPRAGSAVAAGGSITSNQWTDADHERMQRNPKAAITTALAYLTADPPMIESAIERLQAADVSSPVETKASVWVSVEDRKPPMTLLTPMGYHNPSAKQHPVLVATKEGRIFETIYNQLGFANLNSRTDYVTHWMPLPAHPSVVETSAPRESVVYMPCERHKSGTYTLTASCSTIPVKVVCPGCESENGLANVTISNKGEKDGL